VISHGVVAVIMQGGKFLLLKDARELMQGYWAPPHGRCDEKDTSEEESVAREVLEETGLVVKPVRKLWTTKADTKVETVSFWLVNIVGGAMKLDKAESSEHGWFSLEEALKLKLYPGTKMFFELVKEEKITISLRTLSRNPRPL